MKAEDLKNSILQLAMEGKLVPQNPNDEPASVLLEKIRDEKERLIKAKKIKRNNKESFIFRKNGHFYEKVSKKGEPVCIDEEIPFDIPDSWEWCRFGYVVDFSLGKTPPRKELIFWDNATTPWVTISDMVDGKIINCTQENVNNYALEKSFKGILVPKGTLLMSFKLTVGKVSILGLDAVHNEAIISIKPFIDNNNCFRDYLFRVLPLISQTGDTKSAIKGKTLNSKSLNKLLIPLPPFNEQERIVNKIEDIIPLIEEYGVDKEQLNKLNSEFPDKLKSSILQEAIQGKLVPQDSNDEPSSVLLERIRNEKERLIKEKKIKRNKNKSFIYKNNNQFYEKIDNNKPICIDNEIPFEIPNSWEWVRLDTICKYIQRGKSPKYSEIKMYPVVAQKCNQWSGFSLEKAKFIDPKTVDSYKEERILQNKDIMWNSTGLGTLGRVGLYDESVNKYDWAVADSHVTIIRPFAKYVFQEFIYLFLASPTVQLVIESKAGGSTKQKELNLSTIKNYLIPLAPHNEQKRIIDKVFKLNQILG